MQDLDMYCSDCGINLSIYLVQGGFKNQEHLEQVAQILDWKITDEKTLCLGCQVVGIHA